MAKIYYVHNVNLLPGYFLGSTQINLSLLPCSLNGPGCMHYVYIITCILNCIELSLLCLLISGELKTDFSIAQYSCLYIFCICVYRYWTDNGACYYYNTSSKYSDYESLLEAVKDDADKAQLPYRYMQVH